MNLSLMIMMGMLQQHPSRVPGMQRRKHTVITKFPQSDSEMNIRKGKQSICDQQHFYWHIGSLKSTTSLRLELQTM